MDYSTYPVMNMGIIIDHSKGSLLKNQYNGKYEFFFSVAQVFFDMGSIWIAGSPPIARKASK